MSLTNKIDFAVILSVNNANPNGDPLNGNRPRIDYDGYGEISDVCLKRKLRNRLQDMGQAIFVQSNDRKNDEFSSLRERAEACAAMMKAGDEKENKADKVASAACAQWLDVRAFGQVFAYKKLGKMNDVSIGIRGPVSIHSARSVSPVRLSELQITKSVNNEPGDKKGSDTMGLKHRVDFGLYITYGSINTQLATKTGFSDDDTEYIRQALITLFENDTSSARPDGSIAVHKVYWWRHSTPMGQYSSAQVHRSLQIKLKENVLQPRGIEDYDIVLSPLDGLTPGIYEGR